MKKPETSKKEYSPFAEAVRKIVGKIQEGKVLTYKEVAEKAGFPGASRGVGTIMRGNFDKEIPCHRVIRSDGRIGEYNRGGVEQKTKILKKEGIQIENGKVVRKR